MVGAMDLVEALVTHTGELDRRIARLERRDRDMARRIDEGQVGDIEERG